MRFFNPSPLAEAIALEAWARTIIGDKPLNGLNGYRMVAARRLVVSLCLTRGIRAEVKFSRMLAELGIR